MTKAERSLDLGNEGEQKNEEDEEEQSTAILHSNEYQKDMIAILGVQGLTYNDYTLLQMKILLAVIKHHQKLIKEYSVRYQLSHDDFIGVAFTREQRIKGHVDVQIPMAELGISPKHYQQLRQALKKMEEMPIEIGRKWNNLTIYDRFDHLFKSEIQRKEGKPLTLTLSLDLQLVSHFYSFDKGVARIDLNAIKLCKNVSTIKLYIFTQCWAMKGNTKVTTNKLAKLFHGDAHRYKYWSDMERKTLKPACEELKALYDKGIIDNYVTYSPCFPDGEDITQPEDPSKEHMGKSFPAHITFTVHSKQSSGVSADGEVSEQLRGERTKLKIMLHNRYEVHEDIAREQSEHLTLDMLGELDDWLRHKDYYLEQCRKQHRHMNMGGYMAKALRGFFRDHGA